MENFLGDNKLMIGGVGGIFTLAAILYQIYRKILGDSNFDKAVQNVDKFVEKQNSMLKDYEEQVKALFLEIKSLQSDRTTALALAGTLQGDINGLKIQVEVLKDQREQKDIEIKSLKETIIKVTNQNENLLKVSGFLKFDEPKEDIGEKSNGE